MTSTEKKDLIKRAKEAYYNGQEIMSNYEYDQLIDEIGEDEVGAEIISGEKIKHKYPCLSLGKTKDVKEIIKVQNRADTKESIISWKLDGCTLQLSYMDGKLVTVATRGSGFEGQIINHNAPYIKGIPQKIKFKGELVVRGEAYMTYSDFAKCGQGFANARNLASATVSALDTNLVKTRPITFNAFELVVGYDGTFEEQFKWLTNQGFDVVAYEVTDVKNLEKVINEWSDRVSSIDIPVDGLVISHNDREEVSGLEDTSHHPNLTKSIAFKWEDETVETILREIEWSPSKTGLLNPVAIFDEVDLCGTKVSRASLHNLTYIKSLNLKVGDRITVYKANMIIPQVAENLDKAIGHTYRGTIKCPICGEIARIHDNNGIQTIHCENPNCYAKLIGKFQHYVSKPAMNIEGLAGKTLDTLINKGYIKELSDIYEIKNNPSIKDIEGFGTRSFNKLVDSIEKSKKTDIYHFLVACAIPTISSGQVKEIIKYLNNNYDNLATTYNIEDYNLYKLLCTMVKNKYDFTQIDGIGTTLATNLTQFVQNNFLMESEYTRILDYLIIEYRQPKKVISNNISGKTFVITGKLENYTNRNALVEVIESYGAKVSGSVTTKTDYLINNDINSKSSKNKKAKELNIPIITEAQFEDLLK